MKGLVLVGGKSSRMGSPKALIDVDGEPAYVRSAKLLQKVCSTVYLSTSAHFKPDQSTFAMLDDLDETKGGPVSGLVAAFAHDADSAWLVLACDLLSFDDKALATLVAHRNPEKQATCFVGHENRPEPLCAIYEASAASIIRAAYDNDERCARRVLEKLTREDVVPHNSAWLKNVNTPADKSERIRVNVELVAHLREQAGSSGFEMTTEATSPRALYQVLQSKYLFGLRPEHMRVAVNDEMADWDARLRSSDRVMFLPPVAGG